MYNIKQAKLDRNTYNNAMTVQHFKLLTRIWYNWGLWARWVDYITFQHEGGQTYSSEVGKKSTLITINYMFSVRFFEGYKAQFFQCWINTFPKGITSRGHPVIIC